MSSRKFTPAQRNALFDVYDGKCFYTSVALDIRAFHIDHIIPEHLSSDPGALKALLERLDLPATFDIHGYENLVPVVPGANLSKNGDIFNDANFRFYLSRTEKPKVAVAERVAQIERGNSKGKVLLMLREALDSGKMTPEDVAQMLDEAGDDPEVSFRLIEKLTLTDATELDAIRKADIELLRDRVVRLGPNTFHGLTLTRGPDREERYVETCREYEAAIVEGFFAETTFAMKMEVYFLQQSGLLRAIERARIPRRSFVANPKVGVCDWNLLPLELFPYVCEPCFGDPAGLTYQDKIREGEITVRESRHNLLTLEGPMGQRLLEVARADFTGDGLEDILLFTDSWAIGGTFGYGGVVILSRTTNDGSFELVRLQS